MATEPSPDHPALREGRRERLFAAMEAHDLDLLVLGRVANIRYASGVPILWNAGTRPFGPGCVVVRATRELFLLSTWDEGVPEEIPHDHLFGITWNPMNFVTMLAAIAAAAEPRRVGTDALSPLFANLLPMAFPDAAIVDGTPAIRAARRTKTPEEVDAIRAAIRVAEDAVAVAVAELRPGVRERELTAVFMDAMATRGVTTPATQDVVRITSAAGASDTSSARPVQAGDLVSFDAGVVADGYAGEVGRTWPVEVDGDASAVEDLYRRSDDLWEQLLGACRPGASTTGLLDAYPAAGEPLPTFPVARGLGLGFDDPVVVRDLPLTAARETLDPGVVLVVTGCVYDDTVGSVITREVVHITPDGPEVLTSSPFWNRDRAGAQP
jgi:Xaa-Pro aminopeptidase